ncbi:MAG: M23 family metallopeptidase [Acutalibacteraceae bacterium]
MEENMNKSLKPVKKERKNFKKNDGLNIVTVAQIVICLLLGLSFFLMSRTSQSAAFKSDFSKLMSWESFKSDAASVMGYVRNYLSEPVEFFPVFGSKNDESESVTVTEESDEDAKQDTTEQVTDETEAESEVSEEETESSEDEEQPETEKIAAEVKSVYLTKTDLDYQSQDDTAKIVAPVDSTRYTSMFGYRINPITNVRAFHTGLDIAAPLGTKIKAAYNGTVSKTGEDSHSGKYIFLTHANGLETFYCHCSEIIAEKGAKIRQGETIALVGSTGWSTGPHLHFEIHKNGERIDPLPYLQG